jgi:hypothetical protein
MNLVASSRRSYLAEFNAYLDAPVAKPRPRVRRTPA